VGLRYSKIRFTSLYGDVRLEQQSIKQDELLAASYGILGTPVAQTTDFSRDITDLRAGFNTSPWRGVSFDADYHHDDDDNHYQNGPMPAGVAAYPGFIQARDETQDAAEAKLTLRPWARFSTMFSYRYDSINYLNTTAATVPPTITPGGSLISGRYYAHDFSVHTTYSPLPRLTLASTLSYERATTVTASDGTPGVTPYRGDVYSALCNGAYVLNSTTDLLAGYGFSTSDYGESDFAGGVPLGIDYHEQDVHFGITHRFGANLTGKVEYRFNSYHEPTSGNAANYSAHILFLTMTYNWR
jgi:hypothetical protein